MTKEEIGQAVRLRLQSQEFPEALKDITLIVMDAQIYRENGYWRVPIRPSVQPRWVYAYYEVLAEVETELDEADHLKVQLVPLLPEDTIAKKATLPHELIIETYPETRPFMDAEEWYPLCRSPCSVRAKALISCPF